MNLARHRAGPLAALALLTLLATGCGISNPTPHPVVQEEPPAQPTPLGRLVLPSAEQPGLTVPTVVGSAATRGRPVTFDGWTIEQTAVDSLVRIGGPAVPALLKLLDRPEAKIRGEATLALARIGPEARPAVPKLIALVENDPDQTVRKFAVRALGQIGPAAAPAVPVLVEQLRADAGSPRQDQPHVNPPTGSPAVRPFDDDDEPSNVR